MHDALTVGHASTSLAAAFGMALARDARKEETGEDYSVVAVIGDGSLTGGMALAALNQIGHVKPKMTIILNDNEMSISENVGALNTFMRTLQVKPWLHEAEAKSKQTLSRIWQPLVEFGSRSKSAARRFFDPASSNPFHAMGVRYVGPIDGHDIDQLLDHLDHVQQLSGPTMLHIVTKKGKGYKIAESDSIYWHSPSNFDPDNPVAVAKGYTWSSAFGDAMGALSDADDRVWVITPAMREGSGLVGYSQRHPKRYLDVGIAEDVAVTTAAGLALRGEKPVVAIYSTFLQRGFDQVIHDVCLREPRRGLRHRPGGPRRGGRRDPSGRLRHRLPARAAEHVGRHAQRRRGDAGDAQNGALARWAKSDSLASGGTARNQHRARCGLAHTPLGIVGSAQTRNESLSFSVRPDARLCRGSRQGS